MSEMKKRIPGDRGGDNMNFLTMREHGVIDIISDRGFTDGAHHKHEALDDILQYLFDEEQYEEFCVETGWTRRDWS